MSIVTDFFFFLAWCGQPNRLMKLEVETLDLPVMFSAIYSICLAVVIGFLML